MFKAIRVKSTDPSYNLALEEVLFHSLKEGGPSYFLLWQNAPSVIVGRHQNTAEEVNEVYVRDNNIPVVRRVSGGGAVYHDLGNLNFSFLTCYKPTENIPFSRFILPIVDALKSMGLEAELSGRNDIIIDGKKVSGNAMCKSKGRLLQHGTILIGLDVSNLSNILTGNPDKYLSKGVASHKSRVANLVSFFEDKSFAELLEEVCEVLIQCCSVEEIEITEEQHNAALALAESKYRTWDWNFGHSPKFEVSFRQRFNFGALEFLASVKNGVIQSCQFNGDFFAHKDVGELAKNLEGIQFNQSSVREALEQCRAHEYFLGADEKDLLEFFMDNILQ